MFKKYKDNFNNNYTVIHFKKIWPFIKPYKGRALLTLLLAVPLGALDAVVAWSLKPFMDNVMIDKSVETAMYVPLVIIGFSLIQALLNYAVTYLNAWVGLKITFNLKEAMYAKLIKFESKFYDEMQTGNIMVRFSNDVDGACNALLNQTKLMVTRVCSSLALLGVLIYHSWQLSIVAVVALILALYPLKTYRRRVKKFAKESVVQNGLLVSNYAQVIQGNKIVTSYNIGEMQKNKFSENVKKIFRLAMKMTQRTAFLPSIMTLCVSFGIAGVIWYGSYLIVSNEITSGTFVSFIAALIMLFNPIKRMGGGFAALQNSLLAMERVFELYEKEYEIKNIENAKHLNGIEKSIELKNINFEYEEGKPILKNLSLTVKAGEIVALVGNSGGGKSTVVNLLPRFYDAQSGEVLIDGVNHKDYTLESLRDNIAVVLQDNFLFTGTILENITLGKDYSEEEVNSAIKSASLEEFINSLEDGLDTEVGERGGMLSGGQKQRVAIARAFLKNAPVVILDEATSALDNKSEKDVQEAMEHLMKDRTVFVIAHRLTTIINADKIVVINNGEIIEEGSHDDLVKSKKGAYYELYKIQNS